MAATLQENIRELRTRSGISQVEFASAMGVTKQCVSNWENDNVLPSVEMLLRIADYFRVSTDYLLGRSEAVTMSIEGLTPAQSTHLRQIAQDMCEANRLYSELLSRMRAGKPAPQDRS